MDSDPSQNLIPYDIHSVSDYYDQAFSRNIGILSRIDQEKLRNSRIAIPGMGGVGGAHLICMTRSGVGNFNISDFDRFEPVNINRQYGANTSSFNRSKLKTMKEQALGINPYLNIQSFPEGLTSENMDLFLQGVDVVIDGLDFFCFDIRRELFIRAREKGIHVITAGPLGFSSALLVFSPDRGMGFDEYFNIVEDMTPEDKALAFAIGLAPGATHIKYMDFSRVDLSEQAGPSLNVACQICAGMAGTEALRILLGRKGLKPVPHYAQFDPFLMKLKKGRLFWGNRNPIQQIKMKVVKKMLAANKSGLKQAPPKAEHRMVKDQDTIPDDVIRFITAAGIQAPSGDNAQPWEIQAGTNQIRIWVDSDADQSFFNVNQIASIISCGAAVENMKIAASIFGLDSEIEFMGDGATPGANIFFKPDQIQADPLHGDLWNRYTNRTMYKRNGFPDSVIAACQKAFSGYDGVSLDVLTQKKDINRLARIVFTVDRIRTEHRGLHEHLMKMIRFNPHETEESKDGLPLKNLQAGLAGELFLKITRPWKVMNLANKIGLGRMVAMHSYQGIRNSSAVMLMRVDGNTDKDFFMGGRALERVWLTLTRLGYHVQPMTAITLFFMRIFLKKDTGFGASHLKMMDSVKEDYHDLFKDLDPSKGQVMLFRVGKGREIKHFTSRKSILAFNKEK